MLSHNPNLPMTFRHGLILWMSCQEHWGEKLFDRSPYRNVATWDLDTGANYVGWDYYAKQGSVAHFEHTGSNIRAIKFDHKPLYFTDLPAFTWMFWCRCDSVGGGGNYSLVDQWHSSRTDYILRYEDGSSAFRVYLNGDAGVHYTGTTMTDEKWHHVVATWDGTTVMMYFDGVQSPTTDTITSSVGASTDALWVGSANTANRNWEGVIGSFLFWNRALCEAEVVQMYKWMKTE